MRRKSIGMLIAAFALFVTSVVNADDEKIANHLYKKLAEAKKTGALKNFSLDMEVKKGVVYFTGRVASSTQKNMVLTMAQKAQGLGVREIRDGISVEQSQGIRNVVRSSRAQTASNNSPVQDIDYVSNQPVATPVGAPPAYRPARPVGRSAEMPLSAMGQVPMSSPSYTPAGPANGARYDAPGLPNYAWPSYAPHPNYGAVTYPKTYSPTAWPYIGPFYPYPQVPLGWRKVTLEWDDGWWYLDFNDGKQRRRRR